MTKLKTIERLTTKPNKEFQINYRNLTVKHKTAIKVVRQDENSDGDYILVKRRMNKFLMKRRELNPNNRQSL